MASARAASRNGGHDRVQAGGRDLKRPKDCASCGGKIAAGARFCQHCGRSVSGDAAGLLNAQTMTVAGAACLSLVAVGLLFSSVIDDGAPAPTTVSPSRTDSPAPGQPPDLSTMTPREAADRLFNRVMMADEQGNDEEVAQFAPMAIAAYDRLNELDLDALYHVGLIHAATEDGEDAFDVVERLRAVVPGHLLAITLEHRLATAANDQVLADRAIERFRAAYEEEIQVDRPEYRDHRRQIDLFRETIVGR